jgi:dTDP-D-glucose 4,6-dehydratase
VPPGSPGFHCEWWCAAIPILGIAVPELRELIEMRFQTDRPYSVDAGKFQARFGQEATSFEEGLAATVRFYRDATRGPPEKASR